MKKERKLVEEWKKRSSKAERFSSTASKERFCANDPITRARHPKSCNTARYHLITEARVERISEQRFFSKLADRRGTRKERIERAKKEEKRSCVRKRKKEDRSVKEPVHQKVLTRVYLMLNSYSRIKILNSYSYSAYSVNCR